MTEKFKISIPATEENLKSAMLTLMFEVKATVEALAVIEIESIARLTGDDPGELAKRFDKLIADFKMQYVADFESEYGSRQLEDLAGEGSE